VRDEILAHPGRKRRRGGIPESPGGRLTDPLGAPAGQKILAPCERQLGPCTRFHCGTLCHAPAGRRCGPARDSGAVGPRVAIHHPAIYPGSIRKLTESVRPKPTPRLRGCSARSSFLPHISSLGRNPRTGIVSGRPYSLFRAFGDRSLTVTISPRNLEGLSMKTLDVGENGYRASILAPVLLSWPLRPAPRQAAARAGPAAATTVPVVPGLD